MTEKFMKGRLVQKHDTAENWSKATTFIPKQGELIVYDRDTNYDYERFKIGDGITLVNDLPFADEPIVDIIDTKIEALKTDTTNMDAVVLAEAQAYADNLSTNYATAEQGIKADSAVQTINGAAPDENGNVEIDINVDIDIPISSGTGKNSLIIGEGVASGDAAIAGGSTDKQMLESIVGGTVAALVTAKPAEASGNMSLALGANSKAITAGAGTIGFGNQGGVMGYYWDTIDFATNTIKLSHDRRTSSYGSLNYVTDFDWAEGDIISMVNDNNYFARSIITSVDKANSTITVDSLPFTEIKYSTGLFDSLTLKPHDRTIFAVYQNDSDTIKTGKPRWVSRSGSVELGFGNFTLGVMNLNTGNASFTSGYNNWAGGAFGASVGRDNRSGYAAFAGGVETKADAYACIAYGLGLLNTSSSAAVFGQYNSVEDIENQLLVIGCGSSDSNRKNALTVSRTGDVKTKGNIYSNNEKVLTAKDFGTTLEGLKNINNNYVSNPSGHCYNSDFGSLPINWNNGEEGADSYITSSAVATEDLTGLCAHDTYGMIRGGYPASYIGFTDAIGWIKLCIKSRAEEDRVTRYKLLNTITNKRYLDQDDLGKKIKVLFYYIADDDTASALFPDEAVTTPTLNNGFSVGIMSAYGNDYSSTFYTKAISELKDGQPDPEDSTLHEVSFYVTIDQTMIDNGIGLLTFNVSGGNKVVFIESIFCEELMHTSDAVEQQRTQISEIEDAVKDFSELENTVNNLTEEVSSNLSYSIENIEAIFEDLGSVHDELENKADNSRFDSMENPATYLFEQDFSVVPNNWNNGKEAADSYITNSSFHDFTGICGSSVNGALRGGSGIKTIEFTAFLDKTCFHIYATSKCRYKFFNTLTNKETLTQADLGRKVRITAKYFTAQGNSSIGLMSAKSDLYGQKYYKSFASQNAGDAENWADLDVIVTIDQTMIDESAALLTFDIGANSELYFTDIRCVELSSIEEIVEDIADITPDWSQNDEAAPDYIKNRTHYEIVSSELVTALENTEVEYVESYGDVQRFYTRLDFEWNYDLYPEGEEIRYSVTIGDKIIEYKGVNHEGGNISVGEYNTDGHLYMGDIGDGSYVQIYINPEINGIDPAEMPSSANITVQVLHEQRTLKTLDEKYIPTSIARKSSVDSLKTDINTLKTSVVKKINGQTPNTKGEINVSYSYDDLTNKPFETVYEEGFAPLGILDGRSFEFAEQTNGGFYIERITPPEFVYTDGYYVTWDGIEYELGEPNQIDEFEFYISNENAPFTIHFGYDWNEFSWLCIETTEPGPHTVKVTTWYSEIINVVKQLDEKYIPDTIARAEDVISLPPYTAEDEGKILQIVGGKPTWVSLTSILPSAEEAIF